MKKFLIAVLLLIVVLLGVGMVLPTDYSLSRSVVITGDVAKVHRFVGDLKRWEEWTPWKENDPSLVVTYGPTTTGIGASQSWTGEDGNGELTFVGFDPNVGIDYSMAIIMEETRMPASGSIQYKSVAGGTEVTWSMKGDMKGMGIVAGWFATLSDSLMGPLFDQGLNKLKAVVEKA